MARKIFVNLPVADLPKSMAFFAALGFTFNAQFTDDTAACMVISDDIYTMLLTRTKFQEFTTKEVGDGTKASEVLVALSFDSRAEVDAVVDKALAHGAVVAVAPADHGFMYIRSFHDLDGHIWEAFWMDAAAVAK